MIKTFLLALAITGSMAFLVGCDSESGVAVTNNGQAAAGTGDGTSTIVTDALGTATVAASQVTGGAFENAPLQTRQLLVNHMLDRYLWFDTLPALDLSDTSYSDLKVLLEALRKVPEDRFSSLVNAVSQGQRFEQGITQRYGLGFTRRAESPLDIRVRTVDDFGTVGLQGIQRGDRITAAQGVPVDELGYQGFIEIFAESGLGVSRTITVRHQDAREQQYTITRTEHSLNPVRKARVFSDPDSGLRIGYVQVTEFIELTKNQLEIFRNDYVDTIDDLIVDLRYNPGGLVSASRDLASSIYGQVSEGEIYTTLQRNELHRNEDFSYRFKQFNNAFNNLQRVFILTTGSTCSASEEVINGLTPFIDVITIGEKTCGKPYASRSFPLIANSVNANVLESRSVNAIGEGDFFDGLPVVCEVADDPVLPFDDASESLISAAIYYAINNQCPEQILAHAKQRGILEYSGASAAGGNVHFEVDPIVPAIAIQD